MSHIVDEHEDYSAPTAPNSCWMHYKSEATPSSTGLLDDDDESVDPAVEQHMSLISVDTNDENGERDVNDESSSSIISCGGVYYPASTHQQEQHNALDDDDDFLDRKLPARTTSGKRPAADNSLLTTPLSKLPRLCTPPSNPTFQKTILHTMMSYRRRRQEEKRQRKTAPAAAAIVDPLL